MLNKAKLFLALLALLFALSNCRTTRLVSEKVKETRKDSTFVTKDTVKITVPGERVVFSGKLITVPGKIYIKKYDTTIQCPPAKIQPQKIKATGKNGLSGFVSVDSLGNVFAECEQKEREFLKEIDQLNHVITIQKETIQKYKEEKTKFGNLVDDIKRAGMIVLILVVVIGLLILKRVILK